MYQPAHAALIWDGRLDLMKMGLKQLNQRYIVDFHLAAGRLDLRKKGFIHQLPHRGRIAADWLADVT